MRRGLLAAFLIVAFVPVERYRPSCGRPFYTIYFDGRMRDVYVGMITEAMTEEGIPHIRIGNEVFINLIYPSALLPFTRGRQSFEGFAMNTEWRVAEGIAHGYGPNETRVPPPPVLAKMVAEKWARIENASPLDENEKRRRLKPIVGHDCEVLRAASIRIEDLPPDTPLPWRTEHSKADRK